MLYSLYDLYSRCSLNLYEIRKHYLDNFYYQNHSRKDADNVLLTVTNSSRIRKIFEESCARKVVPTYTDFLSTILSLVKFMFKSNEVVALATLDAVLGWDIEVNQMLHLVTQEDLKDEMVKVFHKLSIYEEMSERDFLSMASTPTIDAEIVDHPQELLSNHRETAELTTWSLNSFVKEHGKMKVASFVNKTTGEPFRTCVFSNGKTRTFVAFSSRLGELSSSEIEEMKNELAVVKSPNGKYSLTRIHGGAWEDVNI